MKPGKFLNGLKTQCGEDSEIYQFYNKQYHQKTLSQDLNEVKE
ncbi:hypothetical protein [Candidatus Harpocratesius sp.]